MDGNGRLDLDSYDLQGQQLTTALLRSYLDALRPDRTALRLVGHPKDVTHIASGALRYGIRPDHKLAQGRLYAEDMRTGIFLFELTNYTTEQPEAKKEATMPKQGKQASATPAVKPLCSRGCGQPTHRGSCPGTRHGKYVPPRKTTEPRVVKPCARGCGQPSHRGRCKKAGTVTPIATSNDYADMLRKRFVGQPAPRSRYARLWAWLKGLLQ